MNHRMPHESDSSLQESPEPIRGLRALAVRGAVWTVAGQGVRQVLRLGGNLVLTRLLFPEAFGLMALVQVVLRALEMFSDIGINSSVIRSRRGDDPDYLNTAWTLRAVRGVALWIIASLLAWPVARLYDQPLLLTMIPVVGFSAMVAGFQSIAVLTLQRHVHLRPLVLLELTSSVLGIAVMIGLAYWMRSVWALILGGLFRTTLSTILSYVVLDGPKPRFQWDADAAREMYRYGRWIFVSTALTFLLQQGDRAILGVLVQPETLGVYSIAVLLSRAPLQQLLRLNRRVLFPIFARVLNEQPGAIRAKLYKARMRLLLLFLPPLWFFILFGQQVINLLYDPRYAEAGWMLQWLSVGAAAAVIATSAGGVVLAAGDSFRHMVIQVWRGAALLTGLLAGYHLAGLGGLVAGVSLARLTDYPVLAWAVRRHGAWLPRQDAVAYGVTLVVMIVGLLATSMAQM